MEVSELEDIVIRVHDASKVAAAASKSLRELGEHWAAGLVTSTREMVLVTASTGKALDELHRHLDTLETDIAALEADES